jgi:hypothetical protein
MSRTRVVLVVTTTVLVLGGVVAGSAAAAMSGWRIKGTVLVGSAAVATTAAPVEAGEAAVGSSVIVCRGNLWGTSPQIESANKASASSLKYSECEVEDGECSLASGSTIGSVPAVAEFTLDGTSGAQAGFKARTGNVLATVRLEGSGCAETGKIFVTGAVHTSIAENPGEATLQLVEMNVTAASRELEVGSNGISAHGAALLKLASSLPWGFL